VRNREREGKDPFVRSLGGERMGQKQGRGDNTSRRSHGKKVTQRSRRNRGRGFSRAAKGKKWDVCRSRGRRRGDADRKLDQVGGLRLCKLN